MATKETISSKFVTVPRSYKAKGSHKVGLAYITAKEAEKLKELDMHKSGIAEKMHYGPSGIPNYNGGGEIGIGDTTGPGGVAGDSSGDMSFDFDFDDSVFDMPEHSDEPGAEGGGGDAALDIDDKAEYMTEEECKKRGGRYDGAMCHFDGSPPPPEGDGDGDDEEEDSDLLFERKPYEKAPPYSYKVPKVDPGTPPSETERVRAKTTAATPFAEAVRASMVGEVAGVADKERTIKDMDAKRKFDDAMLSQAQAFAASGMSFSTPMLNAEEEMVRDLARQRLVSADEAAKMQEKLNMARWEASEPIMKLAAEAKLGDAGLGGTFTPGAYDVGKLSSVSGIGIPRFSGLPSTSLDKDEKPITDDKGETTSDDDKDTDTSPSSHFTDKKGDVCYFSETTVDDDGVRSCPGTTVGGEA